MSIQVAHKGQQAKNISWMPKTAYLFTTWCALETDTTFLQTLKFVLASSLRK